MSDKPPFDPVKFACYLIAGVITVQCLGAVLGMLACLYHAEIIIKDPNIVCDPKDRLTQLMTGAVATALALLAGFMGGRGPPPPPKQ